MDEAIGYFRRVAKRTDNSLVRAVARERKFICDAMRISYTPYAPPGKGLSPPAIRPGGLSKTLGAPRALSRMVRDAARVETPFLRAFAACYGYLLKCNMLVSKGKMVPAIAPESPQSRQASPSQQPKGDGPPTKRPDPSIENRPSDRRLARERSPRGSRKYRGASRLSSRLRSRRRSKMSSAADTLADKRVRDERLAAWAAGEDSRGSPRDKCKDCYIGLGTDVPRHVGRTCQDLGNKCDPPRRAPGCDGAGACHWGYVSFNGVTFRRTQTHPCLPAIFGRIRGNYEKREGNIRCGSSPLINQPQKVVSAAITR